MMLINMLGLAAIVGNAAIYVIHSLLDGGYFMTLAQYFADLVNNPTIEESKAQILESDIVKRGRKAVLESHNAAKQFHTTSRLQQGLRNLGFGFSNFGSTGSQGGDAASFNWRLLLETR